MVKNLPNLNAKGHKTDGIFVKMMFDFREDNISYTLNFDNKRNEIYCKDGQWQFDLTALWDKPKGQYVMITKIVRNNKIVWDDDDTFYISKKSQDYCDRIIKLMIFE